MPGRRGKAHVRVDSADGGRPRQLRQVPYSELPVQLYQARSSLGLQSRTATVPSLRWLPARATQWH
jgi:hypothetical protein